MADRIPTEDLRSVGNREAGRRARPDDVTRFGQNGGDGGGQRTMRPAMSHRAATLIALTLGILAFRWWTSGKLQKAAAAWAGPGTGNEPASTPVSGAASAATSGAANVSGHPAPSAFGLGSGSFGDAISFMEAIDSAGLRAFGGGQAVHDWDYGTPIGTPVRDPIASTYLGDDSGPWGHAAVFRADTGGVFELMHLGDIYDLTRGQHVPASAVIGETGGPYPTRFWSGPHLAVIADQPGVASLMGRA